MLPIVSWILKSAMMSCRFVRQMRRPVHLHEASHILGLKIALALTVTSIELIAFDLAVASVGLIASDLVFVSFASTILQEAVGAI